MTDFLVEGGTIKRAEFYSPSELNQVAQRVVINTGYGARALWKDESIVPVRGQLAWLIPQPEVNYGVFYKNVGVLARRDGIVVQDVGKVTWKATTIQMRSRTGARRNPPFRLWESSMRG